MALTAQAQAVLLLTAHLGKAGKSEARPLSVQEWSRFALWLRDNALPPELLLSDDSAILLARWTDRTITVPRIVALLGRGGALGLALERWQRAGLWVLTRADPAYPERLKRRLRGDSPPVLFGCGDQGLLNRGGLAIVGSRDAATEAFSVAAQLAREAAAQGLPVVSGGARGIDETAMLAALEGGGTSIGVLADSLLRTATSAKYRNHVMQNALVLISPFNPEAGFDVGTAMARNRYIYCLADGAVVVSSTPNKGGTWAGAIENLKERWVPLWVSAAADEASGNPELVRRGARWLPDDRADISYQRP